MNIYYALKLKKTGKTFLIPFLLEIIFLICLKNWNNNESLSMVHGLWFLAINVVLLLWIISQNINDYYLNSDELLNIIPKNKEIIIIVNTILYIMFFEIFAVLGQYVLSISNYKLSFSEILQYIVSRFLSVAAFLFLLNFIIFLFKNVQRPTIGKAIIFIFLVILISLQIWFFWRNNIPNGKDFFMGVNSKKLKFIYLNILPISILDISGSMQRRLAILTNELNGLIVLVSVIGFLGFSKIKKTNYINLMN